MILKIFDLVDFEKSYEQKSVKKSSELGTSELAEHLWPTLTNLDFSEEVRHLRARIAQLERKQTMNSRTSSSAKGKEAAKCVESERVEQLELELKETNRKLDELGNILKDALEKGMQLKGELTRMGTNQNKLQLNIVALQKTVAVLNDKINGKGKKSVNKRHCTHCQYSTHRPIDLKRHLRIHTGEKPHECQHCGQRFNNKSNLVGHQRVHTGERPFKCQQCDQQFRQPNHLSNHQRIHTGEKPFKCQQCDQQFRQPNHLSNHQRIHTGEKPFKCQHCGQQFRQSSHLSNHQRIHTGEKPFKCQHCDKRFRIAQHLSYHQRVHKMNV